MSRNRVLQIRKYFSHIPVPASIQKSFYTMYRIARAATEKFILDNCSVRANAVAYAIVISVIPLLAIVVRFANIDQQTLNANVARFLATYGVTETAELLSILNEILERSQAIASAGFIFMIYSATNLIRNLEDSFNFIYRARRNRPLVYRFSLYIASFVVLPVFIISSYGAVKLMLNQITPADFTHIVSVNGKKWIAGNNGVLRTLQSGELTRVDLHDKIAYDAPFRDVFFDLNNNRSGPTWEIAGENMQKPEIQKSDLYQLSRMAVGIHNELYVISRTGLLLLSKDRGQTWEYYKLAFKIDAETHYSPLISDIYARQNRNELLLLVTVGSRSGLVHYRPDQLRPWYYQNLPGLFDRIHRIDDIAPDAQGPFQNGLYITGRGKYIISNDDGTNWSPVIEERYANKSLDIAHIQATADGNMFFAGSGGAFWFHTRSGKQYRDLRTEFDQHVRTFKIFENGEGILIGENGLFRYTLDGGQTWLRSRTGIFNQIEFYDLYHLEDGTTLLAGENETLLRLLGPTGDIQYENNGLRLMDFDYETMVKYPLIKATLFRLLVGGFIFFTILLVFMLAYMFIPNARVRWRPAMVGGAITAISLLAFIIGFRVFMSTSSTTVFIYGVWAAIPLGMLIILISTQIILYGLEVAFVLQHPYLYRARADMDTADQQEKSLLWNSILLLTLAYHSIYDDKKPLNDERALKHFDHQAYRLDYIRNRLIAAELLSYDSSEGEYFPTRPASEIKLSDLQQLLLNSTLEIPDYIQTTRSEFYLRIKTMLDQLREHLNQQSQDTTIADLLPMARDSNERNGV